MRVIIEINDGAYEGMEMDARSKGVAIVDVIESAVERIFGEGSVRIDREGLDIKSRRTDSMGC